MSQSLSSYQIGFEPLHSDQEKFLEGQPSVIPPHSFLPHYYRVSRDVQCGSADNTS